MISKNTFFIVMLLLSQSIYSQNKSATSYWNKAVLSSKKAVQSYNNYAKEPTNCDKVKKLKNACHLYLKTIDNLEMAITNEENFSSTPNKGFIRKCKKNIKTFEIARTKAKGKYKQLKSYCNREEENRHLLE